MSVCLIHQCDWILAMQLELKRQRFGDGLEGVLELINSVNLTDMLQAADEDIAIAKDLSQHDIPKAEDSEQADDVLANSALSRDLSYHV